MVLAVGPEHVKGGGDPGNTLARLVGARPICSSCGRSPGPGGGRLERACMLDDNRAQMKGEVLALGPPPCQPSLSAGGLVLVKVSCLSTALGKWDSSPKAPPSELRRSSMCFSSKSNFISSHFIKSLY